MEIFLSEKDTIALLNCIYITQHYLREHTREELEFLKLFFDFNEYTEIYNTIVLLNRRISLKSNKIFRNKKNDIYFSSIIYEILKTEEKEKNITKKYNFFKNFIDNFKKVV